MNNLEYLQLRLAKLGLKPEQASKISEYIDFLLKANKRISLTRFTNMDSWFTAHVEDALRAYEVFKTLKMETFVDCGSGNGIPGVIFAILSDLPFILCDVDQRKAEFLKVLVYRLHLNGRVAPTSLNQLNLEGQNVCFVYRGLGPDQILLENFETHALSHHFRMVSEGQTSIFNDSQRHKYELSDGSSREIELFSPKFTT